MWQAARPLRDAESGHLFRGITFGAHEFGHLFFAVGGEWLAATVLGSLLLFRRMATRRPDAGRGAATA